MRTLWVLMICLGLGCADPSPLTDGGTCFASPSELDFGEVELDRGAQSGLRVTNLGGDRVVTVEVLTAPPFFNLMAGDVFLRNGETPFPIQFLPGDALLHVDEFRLRDRDDPEGTCNIAVPVRGLGAGSVVPSPASLEFGFLNPGQERTLELRLANHRREQVTVGMFIENNLNSPFSFSTPNGNVIPARSELVVLMKLAPDFTDVTRRELVIVPSAGPRLVIPMRFTLGVPVAEYSDVAELPRVGFTPGTRALTFAERSFRVRNLASAALPDAVLRLRNEGEHDGGAAFTVDALDGGSRNELSVTVPDQWFDGIAGGDFADVSIRVAPHTPGPRLYRLTFRTNEPADHVVMIQTVAEVLPPCLMRVEPSRAITLAPKPDGGQSAIVTFTNTGNQPCYVDDPHVALTTYAPFSIVAGGGAQIEVPFGATHTMIIAGPGTRGTPHVGDLRFHIFNTDSVIEARGLFAAP